MRRQRGADFLRRGGAQLVALSFERAARSAYVHRCGERRLEPLPGGDVELEVDRRQRNLREAGVGENPPHALFVGEGERAGVLGADVGQAGNVLARRFQGDHLPGIELGRAPAGEDQPSAARRALAQVGEAENRVGEEHHAEAREQKARPAERERVRGGVGEDELDGARRARQFARPRHHRRGNVEADDAAGGADPGRDLQRRHAAAAPDVDDALAGRESRSRVEQVGDRRQDHVLRRLPVDPTASAGAVPVSDLIGVAGVGEGSRHQILRLGPKA